MFCDSTSAVRKQPRFGTHIILHLTFSEAIKEHKSLGIWKGEGLVAIEGRKMLGGVAKRLGYQRYQETRVR